MKEAEVEGLSFFEKGDRAENLHSEQWYAGMVVERNKDCDMYFMMWRVKDSSQGFDQPILRQQATRSLCPTCMVQVCS